jgi:hypothetical protein
MTIIPDHQPTDADQAAAEHADQLATDIETYAAFLRANPTVAAEISSPERFLIYILPGDDAKQTMADILRTAKAAGATITKDTSDKFAGAEMHFGRVAVKVYSDREVVCERRVTGTRTVEVEEKDPEALAQVPTRTVTQTVDEVEWVCTPILQADDAEAEQSGADR